ncbi:hypothetical protein HZB90_04040, partial [archaeon]|nr:hypothetical protein [archaeon]
MVQNTGDVTSTFMITASGKAAEWTNLAPQGFYLEPGDGKQVDRFIKVPCSARGEYALNTTIKTLFDLEKVIEQKLVVENCNNIQIVPKFSGTQEECPCTPVQYSFDVINTGRHTEIYQISVEPYSEAISLSTDLLILDPGQKETVDVFINLECGQYGEQTFTFNALAEGTGLLGQSDFTLNINKCYDYELAGDEQYSICQGVPNIIPFTLNNKAEIANEYFITLESEDGIDWAYPENDTLRAWGGETISSTIIASPPADDEESHTLTLNAMSTRGEEQITKTLVLESEKCYDYQILDNEEFKAVQCEPTSHTYTIKNIGSRETKYLVEIEGNDWLTTTAGEMLLAAGEESEITLTGTAPCDALGEVKENVYVTIEDINQTYVEEKTLSVYTKEDSYLPEIEIPELKVDYTGGEAEIKITNTGSERRQTRSYGYSQEAHS